jgi:hypothetical protein
LCAVADRFNLPAATVNSVFDLRDLGVSESQRIAVDRTMSPEQKTQAMQDLVEGIRSQVRTQLGEEIGNAYLQQNMRWLRSVADGYAVEFTPIATVRYRRVAPPPQPAPAPATTPRRARAAK